MLFAPRLISSAATSYPMPTSARSEPKQPDTPRPKCQLSLLNRFKQQRTIKLNRTFDQETRERHSFHSQMSEYQLERE
ncbi:unnamed protein product [Caenorhabditis sp. 36 PRJEB53466]|nr:unnamed protein product [Caenorhabditis sp. 36 PRJEB53466]